MMLDRLGGPAAWTDSPNFGFSQQSTHTYVWSDPFVWSNPRIRSEVRGRCGLFRSNGEWARQLDIYGPLHWAALYGQHETFAILVAWFRKNRPESLLRIFRSNSTTSLLHCAVYYLRHPGSTRRMRETLKLIKAVAGLLPDDIQYEAPSPLFLVLQSANPGVALIEALLSVPGGREAYRDHWGYMQRRVRPAVFGALLDAEPSGKSILLSHLMTKFRTYKLFDQDWINFKAALQRAPQVVKDATVKEFLSKVPSFGEGYWDVTHNPLITLKIHGCRLDHQPLPSSDLTAQQFLLFSSDLDKPAVAFLLSWLVGETGLDCAPFVLRLRSTHNLLYPGPTTTVREMAIQSGCSSLYSIVLDIPHVPLPDAVPEAARAIFAQYVPYQWRAEYVAMFLRYPGDVADIFQWTFATAAVHDTIPLQCRASRVSEFINFVGHQVALAMKSICDNRENGMEEMREAGRRLSERFCRLAVAEEEIPVPLIPRILGICQWTDSL